MPVKRVDLRLVGFNDFHGAIDLAGTIRTGFDENNMPITVPAGGSQYMARYVAEMRAEQPNTVVVSAGDLIGASPLVSALFHDEPSIETMNLLGLDILGVGNHEFDEGSGELLRMRFGGCHAVDLCYADNTPFTGAQFSILSANVFTGPGPDQTLFPPYEVRDVDGVKVGFIGLTLEGTPQIVTPAGVAGLTFKDEIETVNGIVKELQEQDVHVIVVLIHEGGFQTGLYDECEGISGAIVDIAKGMDPDVDVVVSGHTHQAYNCVIEDKIVTSASSNGRLLTKIDLGIDANSGEILDKSAENVIVTRDVTEVPEVQALIDTYDVLVAPLRDRVVGAVAGALTRPNLMTNPSGESTMGDVIADAQLAATRPANKGGAVVAFMNPGGIRSDLPAGNLTYGLIFTSQPFGNILVVMTLTGQQIDDLLEQQFMVNRILQPSASIRYTWDEGAPVGQRVDIANILIDGVAVDPAAAYRVTVNNFLSTGGDGFTVLRSGTNLQTADVDVDALEKYLQPFIPPNAPLDVPALGRITRIPPPPPPAP